MAEGDEQAKDGLCQLTALRGPKTELTATVVCTGCYKILALPELAFLLLQSKQVDNIPDSTRTI